MYCTFKNDKCADVAKRLDIPVQDIIQWNVAQYSGLKATAKLRLGTHLLLAAPGHGSASLGGISEAVPLTDAESLSDAKLPDVEPLSDAEPLTDAPPPVPNAESLRDAHQATDAEPLSDAQPVTDAQPPVPNAEPLSDVESLSDVEQHEHHHVDITCSEAGAAASVAHSGAGVMAPKMWMWDNWSLVGMLVSPGSLCGCADTRRNIGLQVIVEFDDCDREYEGYAVTILNNHK